MEFVTKISIFLIVFGFVWNWFVAFPLIALITLIRQDWLVKPVKIAGLYFMTCGVALITLDFSKQSNWMLNILGCAFVWLILVLSFGSNLNDAHKQIRNDSNPFNQLTAEYKIQSELPFELSLMYGHACLYLAALFFPILVSNPVSLFVHQKFLLLASAPVFSLILGVFGWLWMITMVMNFALGIFFSRAVAKAYSSPDFREQVNLENDEDNDLQSVLELTK